MLYPLSYEGGGMNAVRELPTRSPHASSWIKSSKDMCIRERSLPEEEMLARLDASRDLHRKQLGWSEEVRAV